MTNRNTVSKTKIKNALLVERFVATFEKLDELVAYDDDDPVAWELAFGERDQYGGKQWRPIKVSTDFSQIETIYSKLPGRFPPLYERLILSYRWAEVDLQSCRLLANPPGPGLDHFLQRLSKDPAIWKCTSETGYIRFGMGADMDYDPVCFDLSSRKKNGD